jgi:hypothetical protein
MATDRGVERNHGGRVVDWRVLAQALMWAMVIEVTHVLVENGAGMSLVIEQQPVGALLANTADESLGIAVRPRSPGRDLDDVDAFGGEEGVEGVGELGVPVADQEAERADLLTQVHQQVTGDLGGPGGGRVGGHTEDMDPAGAHFHNKKDVKSAQRDGVEGEEVGGQQPRGLSPQEGSPSGVCSALSSLKGTGLVKLGLTLIVDLFSVVLRRFWAAPVAVSGSGIGPRGPTA